MSYGAVPPPQTLFSGRGGPATSSTVSTKAQKQKNEDEYNRLASAGWHNAISGDGSANSTGTRRRTHSPDEDYFDDDELDRGNHSCVDFKRARIAQSPASGRGEDGADEEDDLDAFMSGINAQANADRQSSLRKEEMIQTDEKVPVDDETGDKGRRDDIEEEDAQESYFNFLEDYKVRHENDDEDVYEYDEDGNIVWTWKKVIDPLPSIDHSAMAYKPFNRDLYKLEHEDIAKLSPREVFELRNRLDIRVYGSDVPRPVVSFAHLPFDEKLMRQIRNSEYERPTPIQSQAIPAALKGRDVLGLAKTGSGKTVAYLWPAIIHIMHQEELAEGDGPIALVVVPTRELAIQVYQQAKLYCHAYNIATVCAYGGGSKYEQKQALETGAELVIGTPGRIIDLVKMGATNFRRTTFLCFDEVDRMFDLGFEPQVKSIADHIRADRQCLMFSATMKSKVEKLVAHALTDPVKIVCGDVGEVNSDVEQRVVVLPSQQAKLDWLLSHYVPLAAQGKLLVFVTKKLDAEEVAKKLRLRDAELVLLHGDQHQLERNEQITGFRARVPIMVATDVAARGLDIPEIRNVVNFDVARDIDTHVHRVGRTGRAGQKGYAHTLVTDADKEFCGHLVKNLESAGQSVPVELLNVALKSEWFKREREGEGGTGGQQRGASRTGLGFNPKKRPGLGLTSAPTFPSASTAAAASTAAHHHSSSSTSTFLAGHSSPPISKMIQKAKNYVESSNEGGMNRAEMMRSAMRSTFSYKFQRSSTNEFEASRPAASDPIPEWKRRLEASVANINKAVQEKDKRGEGGDSHDDNSIQRRQSRWGQMGKPK